MQVRARFVVRLRFAALITVLMLWSPGANAAGTASGTSIDNTASVDYKVGGIDQTTINSNTATFVVDNRIDLTVTTVDVAIVNTVPGGTNQVLTLSVTNDGNTVQDYSLAAAISATGAFGETESFDAGNVRVFVDGNANGTYELANDTATYIDELAPDATITVFVVSDIAVSQVNGDVASYDLIATTAVGGTAATQGTDITSDDSGDADLPGTVQIVFADGAGSADAATDGQHSSKDGYKVASASLAVVKGSTVSSDPINGGTNPKAIPGATVDYTIDIDNNGASAATDVMLVDAVPTNTAFVVGSVSTTPAVGPTVEFSDDNAATWTYAPSAGPDGSDTAVTHVRVTFSSIANGSSAQAVFQVLIQ
jgi:uncharacterized repeat protein (TIGR01451 family)